MNKHLILSALIMLGTVSAASAACGRQSSCSNNGNQTQNCSAASVPEALANLTFIQGKPDTKAKYYIYLHSASWCGPCRKAMPDIVKAYQAMKKEGFEIILLGHDTTEAQVKKYAQSHKAEFPALLDSKCSAAVLPGYKTACGIPHFFVVDQAGNELHSGHPASFFPNNAWKQYAGKWNASGSCSSGGTGSSCSGGSCSGGQVQTIASAKDMNAFLTDMAAELAAAGNFESTLDNPGKLVWKTLAGNDHIGCYGIAGCSGQYTLLPKYVDATRILYAYHQETTSSSCKSASACANSGNEADLSADERKAMEIMRDRLKEIVNEDMTPEQIVLAIHDDLVNRASYSFKGDCYSATGIILNDTGVCNAYALYMNVALNMVGIPCHRVVGNQGFNHAWNLVKLNDEWYHLDATWDDPLCCSGQEILRHTYFCVSDATISRDHTWDRHIYPASAKEDLVLSECGSYASSAECMSAIQEAAGGSASSIEGRAAYATDSATFAKALASVTSQSGAGCPVRSYVLDPSTGYFIVNFGSPETDVVPEELQLEKSPVESKESAAKWINVESPELNAKAQEILQKFLSPESSKTWEDFLKESQNVLSPTK